MFAGEYLGDPVPGAFERGGRWRVPPDAAWIFAAAGLHLLDTGKVYSQDLASASAEAVVRRAADTHESLYNFQLEGAHFLASHDYAILADEMGLGKTVQALRAAEARLPSVAGENEVLILCPALAKRHWGREVERWTGLRPIILDGLRAADVPRGHRYVIANYDILYGQRRRDDAGKLHDVERLGGWHKVLSAASFPIVICDEAHMLRGEKSRRTQAVKAVCKNSTCVWLLTGTPMPNHVRDIWALWDLCSDGLAGYYWPWAKAYCGAYKGQYGWVADGRSRLDELQKRLSFFVLGRSKAQVGLQLPPKRRETVQVDVGEVQTHRTVLGGPDGAGNPSKTNAVAAALRATAAAKRQAVTDMAREALEAGQKVVVFVYLREQAERISHDLRAKGGEAARVFSVTGAQSPEQRDMSSQGFRELEGAGAFVATIDSVGVAISLVGADLVIFGDLSWEPAKLLQAEGRAHRHGSTNPVLIRYVIAAGTIDETVADSVVDKLGTIEEALGSHGDAELTDQLSRGRATTGEAILDRLYAKLTEGR